VNKKLRLALSAALLTWVIWQTDWQRLLTAFAGMRVELWLAALAMLGLAQLVSAWRWQMLARPLGFERSVPQLLGYYFIGMYFNLLLPTSVGGDVVRAWYLNGRSGRRLAALAAVFLDRFSGLVVLLALACAGVLLSPLALPPWIAVFVWGSTTCALVGIAAVPVLARLHGGAAQRLHKVRLALAALAAPRLLAGSTFLSIGVQAGNVILVLLLGEALGAQVPLAYYWILVPMVTLLTMLPISINGTGVREGAMVLFLAPLGTAKETAVALALLWFTVFLAASLLGGLVYVFGRFERPALPAQKPAEGEADNGLVRGDSDQGRTRQHQTAA
jgi:uncharacterized membrane protein YbhN (UPF0104 family)